MSAPACRTCGYVQRPGENWGFLDGASGPGAACKHMEGQRRCDCCTQDWYAEGNDSTWDCDGCAHEDCPECVAANGAEVAAMKTYAPWFRTAVPFYRRAPDGFPMMTVAFVKRIRFADVAVPVAVSDEP